MDTQAPYRYQIIPVLSIVGIGLVIGLIFIGMSLPVQAQGNSATPTLPPVSGELVDWYTEPRESWDLPFFLPDTSEGDAVWELSNNEFESLYPNGFVFRTHVTSNKGDIVEASIIFSHAPAELKRRAALIYPNGEVVYQWEPDVALPPWVAVNYYWSFTDSSGNRYRSPWILGNEYADYRNNWERVETEDVIVFVQRGLQDRVLDETLTAMRGQHDTYVKAWGGPLSYKPRVILFSNRDDFFRWQEFFIGSSVVGRTAPEWGATVQIVIGYDYKAFAWGTVLHEIAHLYQFEYAQDSFANSSFWFNEGNATLFEVEQDYDYERRVRDLVNTQGLPILFQGDGPGNFDEAGRNRLAYDVGYTFWYWLVEVYGWEAHRRVIEGMQAGLSGYAAMEAVTGLSTVAMETQWREWLGAFGPPPTLIPTAEYRFPPTITPMIFPTRSS